MLFDLAIVPNVKDVIVPLIFGALVLGWVPIVAAAISAIGSYMAARQQAKGAQNVDLPEYSGRYFEGIRAKKSAKQAYKTLLDIMNARGATDPRLLNRELTGIQRGTETQTQDMEQYLAQLGLTGSGTGQAMRAAIGQAGENLVRIKALYSDSQVRARSFGGWSMPVQYYRIRSEGDSGVGDEVKVVEVTRTLSSAPGIMDYVLYSGGSLVK